MIDGGRSALGGSGATQDERPLKRLAAADAGAHALVVVSGPNPAYTELARPKVSAGTAYSTAPASPPDPVVSEPPAPGRSTRDQEIPGQKRSTRQEAKEAEEAGEEATAQTVLWVDDTAIQSSFFLAVARV